MSTPVDSKCHICCANHGISMIMDVKHDRTVLCRPHFDQLRRAIPVIRDFGTVKKLFHTLWTKAVGTKGYNKSEWKLLESVIWK
jgi:hypothetical protein